MKRSMTLAATTIVLTALLLPALVAAQDDGKVARVAYWTVKDGHEAEFEAGLAAHNKIHADHSDPTPLFTWQIVGGKRNGQYFRASFGHKWADFDRDSEFAAADEADAAENINPHLAREEPIFGVAMPKLSNLPSGPPSGVSRVIYFHVRPGKQAQFEGVIGKIGAALDEVEGGWPPYLWYQLVTGSLPTYVISLPRANWAGFDEDQEAFVKAITAKYGEDGMKTIFEALAEAVEHEHGHFAEYRAELSYIPAAAPAVEPASN